MPSQQLHSTTVRRRTEGATVPNHMKPEKRVQLLRLLAEGNSVRSTARLLETNIRTVLRHLVLAGEECRQFMHRNLVDLKCQRLQCDEIWTFVQKKQKRVRPSDPGTFGDQFLYLAFDQDTKLICTYAIGKRDSATTERFIEDLARRVSVPTLQDVIEGKAIRPQVSTDGWQAYPNAVANSFGRKATYGQLIKMYGENTEAGRYAPASIIRTERRVLWGPIDPQSICTSHVERCNLTVRTFIRRFTRLSLGFSKRIENLRAAVALHVFHYNFCRIHGRLKRTPAMAAGVTERLWSIADLFG
jgi:IS1 family transposase